MVKPAPAIEPSPVLAKGEASRFLQGAGRVRAEVDPSLKRDTHQPASVELPTRADGFVRIESDSSKIGIEFTLRGARRQAQLEVSDSIAVYDGGAPEGGDVLLRITKNSVEDFVVLNSKPSSPHVDYAVNVTEVAGLRLYDNTLEFLARNGDPQVRVHPPMLYDADGVRHWAKLSLIGCQADDSGDPPWDRPVTPPRASECTLRVSWDDSTLIYPAILDPVWATAADMSTARYQFPAVKMGNGRTLVCGGLDSVGDPLKTCEIFNPAGGTSGEGSWAATTAMGTARYNFNFVWLGTAQNVLAFAGDGTPTSEKYNGTTWTASTGDLSQICFNCNGGMNPVITGDNAHIVYITNSGQPYVWTASNNSWAKAYDNWGNLTYQGTLHPSPVANYRYYASVIGIPGQNTILRAGGYWSPVSSTVHLKSAERYRPSIDPVVIASPGCAPSPPLPSTPCATGRVCQAGACVPLDATCNAGAGCPGYQYCKAGSCRDIDRSCSPACGAGFTCDGGVCAPLGGACSPTCPAGQYCNSGNSCQELVPDCGGGCGAGAVCYYGGCYSVGTGCSPACGPGQFCTNWNACYTLPLGCSTSCTNGQVCDGDTCVGANPWTTPGDAASMDLAHSNAAVMALDSNRVMVYGGSNALTQTSKAEIYNGSGNTWSYTTGDIPNNGSASQSGHGQTYALHGSGKFLLAHDQGIHVYDPVAAASPFLSIQTYAYNFNFYGSQGNVTTAGTKVLMVPVQPQGNNSPAQKACRLFDFGDKGSFCTNTGECKAGLTCVQDQWNNPDNKSVCCDSACTEGCMSCRAVNKTSGVDDGTCGPRKINQYVGTDNCPYTDPSTCGTSGYYCDGAGSCAKYPNTQRCGYQGCADSDTQNNERFCDGNGACAAQTTTECDDGYLCNGSQCYTYCYSDGYCESDYFCNTSVNYPGTCDAKKSDGTACNYNNAECVNGNCVDGVCCNEACNDTCEACTNALTGQATGTCNPVTAGTDPNFECNDYGAGNCGQNGSCDGAGACQLYSAGTTCVTANCASATSRNNTDSCNGTGTCVDGGVTNCSTGYACVSGVCQTSCTTDTHCASTYYCDTANGQCVPDKMQGQSCVRDAVCSGNANCVDGVCCDSSCTGSCRSCLGARSGLTDGTCGNIVDDTDPENECTMEVGYPGSCQAPGLCNGAGACRTYAKFAVECDVDDCAGSTLKSYECNGTGLCKEKSVSCYPFLCNAGGTACRVDCSDDAHCVTGSSCENGTCVGQLELGQSCTRGAQCKSTYCANIGEGWLDGQDQVLDPVTNEPIVKHEDYAGVCCDEDCRGQCRGCKKSIKGGGSDGVCDFVADQIDPKDDCVLDTANACGRTGACDGGGECRIASNGTSCGTTSCQGNSVRGQVCDTGVCVNDSAADCAPYVCKDVNGAFQCAQPCADDNDCQDAYYCSEMTCKKKLANGQACETNGICANGFCVDGVCCDARCNGQCEACAEPGKEGSCVAVDGQPRGNRTECDFAGEECGGSCDGVNAAACDYAPTGTECGEASCTNSVADASECDGSGSCRPKDPERCLPFACGDDDRCLITCAIDEDCSSGFRCDVAAQSCVPANVSAECSEDSLDSVGQNGIKTPCKPFLCVASSGTCAVSCAFTQDCAPGFVCEASTKTCLPAPEGGAGEEEGCACRAAGAPTRSSHHYLALVALGLAVAGLRRRRRPQLSE